MTDSFFSNWFRSKKEVPPPAAIDLQSVAELQRNVRLLEISSRKLTNHLFAGEYQAAFRGRGMRFREVREYQPGDDIRFIDWNVSARFNHPFSKLFEEERELVIYLLIDISASNYFGAISSKRKLIQEIATVLSFSAVSNQDKVGAIFFGNQVERFVPPKKGRQHALHIVREMVGMNRSGQGSGNTRMEMAIRHFNQVSKQRSIAFILSDFSDVEFQHDLKQIAGKHDVIGVHIFDPLDEELPRMGLMPVQDLESGEQLVIDTENELVRYQYQEHFKKHTLAVQQYFRKAGADLLQLRTDQDYVAKLQQFFLKRC